MNKEHAVAAADMIVVDDEGKILLTRRAIEPYKDHWVFPGGHIKSETPVEAVKRELFEETALKVEVDSLYGAYTNMHSDPRNITLSVFYVGHVVGGKIERTIEVVESKFFALNDLPKEIGFNHQEIIDDYKKSPEGQPLKK